MADSGDTAAKPTPASAPSSPKLYYIKEARAKSVPQQFTGSHDLMTTFNLLPLYNQYVKQKTKNNEDLPPIEPTYFPFISDLPGKNAIRPGNYIRALLEAPEKSYGPIHPFASSTIRDGFTLRPGPVPGFDSSVLGTDEDGAYKQIVKDLPVAGDSLKAINNTVTGLGVAGYADLNSVPLSGSPAPSSHSQQHHQGSHSHSHNHGDRGERGDGDGSREHRHKKKKKKRKHEHDHEHTHHEGEGDTEHRKKKKRKKEREEHGEYGEHGEHIDIV
ncbi:hypothetical protein BC939DRAFT_318959 [Gamsiella multidivaricata]|uniref:uncharacterized protein n=1 Tax=Gamsiella multidivaricata TaxID=101098 RepID=UPI0022202DD2|nr:uncharacterized protein BC939DRAFT_318959 [Gamsiella multidivaricata]KAI7817617.1 hypothetical protein BC939DRAFT_318959 [Gamsiella multidivaricata]